MQRFPHICAGLLFVTLMAFLSAAAKAQAPTYITQWGSLGTGNGQFDSPVAVAVDPAGNVYVAEYLNHRVQKFTSAGAYLTQWGANGSGPGQFQFPIGVAVDASGNVYVADQLNHRVQKFTSTGAYLTQWGTNGSGPSQFQSPANLAVSASGDVYVADQWNYRVHRFTGAGTLLTQWGNSGGADGQFSLGPWGVAVDAGGNVYVADGGDNQRIQKFTGGGAYLTQWGTLGSGNGQLSNPAGLAVDASLKDVDPMSIPLEHREALLETLTADLGLAIRWCGECSRLGLAGGYDDKFEPTHMVTVDGRKPAIVPVSGVKVEAFAGG